MKEMSKEDIKTRVTLKCFDDVERRLKLGGYKTFLLLTVNDYVDMINEMYDYWYELTPSKETVSEILNHIHQYICEY